MPTMSWIGVWKQHQGPMSPFTGGWEPWHWFPQRGTSEGWLFCAVGVGWGCWRDRAWVLWGCWALPAGYCGAWAGGGEGEENFCLGAIRVRRWGQGLPRGPGALVVGPGEEAVGQAPHHFGVVVPKEWVQVTWGGAAPTRASILSPTRGGSRAGGGGCIDQAGRDAVREVCWISVAPSYPCRFC